jgi:hypothetical protein
VIFKNFFAESEKNCTWQRNSLPRVDQLALGKEISGECSFLCRELFVCLSAQIRALGRGSVSGSEKWDDEEARLSGEGKKK